MPYSANAALISSMFFAIIVGFNEMMRKGSEYFNSLDMYKEKFPIFVLNNWIINPKSTNMKSKLFLKTMRKAFTILAGLLLLLAFAQCKKNKENQENEEKFELACDAIEYIDENMQS